LGLNSITPPSLGSGANQWEDYWFKTLLRILPGDEGYVAWTQAKLAFLEGIKASVPKRELDDEEDIFDSFPLVLPKI